MKKLKKSYKISTLPEAGEAILHISRAKGNYKAGSDIDIAFKGENINLVTLNMISLKLDDLYFP